MTAPLRSPGKRADDSEVLAAVLEVVNSDWFYEFDQDDNQKAYGISTVGASEYARIRSELRRPIRFSAADVYIGETTRDGDRGVSATVVARDAVTGAEGIGHAFYPHYTGIGTNRERQEFNDRIAVSVAKRNAILDLMPVWIADAILAARTRVAKANDRRDSRLRKNAVNARLAAAKRIPSEPAAGTTGLASIPDDYPDSESVASAEGATE